MSAKDRDGIVDVSKALRETITWAIESGAVNRRSRVLLANLYLTAGWSKLGDRVWLAQIAAIARIPGDTDNRHTRRYLHELAELGVVVWDPGRGGQRSGWVGLRQLDPNRPLVNVIETVPDPVSESGQIRTGTGPHLAPLPSSTPEEWSEEKENPALQQQQVRVDHLPRSEAHYAAAAASQNDEHSEETAAAENECARESEIRSTIEALPGSDVGSFDQLYPLARQLPRVLFFDVATRLGQRARSGRVRNQTGYFRHLLEVAARELNHRLVEAAAAHVQTRSPAEHAALEAESYARGRHPWFIAAELIEKQLRRLFAGIDDADVRGALAAAKDAYDLEAAA